MAQRLKNLRIERVDLCDAGANQEAHIVLFKRAPEGNVKKIATRLAEGIRAIVGRDATGIPLVKMDEQAATFDDMLLRQNLNDVCAELGEYYSALMDTLWSVMQSADADKKGLIAAAVRDFADGVSAAIPGMLDVEAVGKIGRKIAGDRLKRIKSTYDMLGKIIAEAEGAEKMAKTPEEIQVEKDTEIQKKIDAAVAKVTADAAVEIAKANTAAAASQKTADEATALAKTEKTARQMREFTDVAKAFQPVPTIDPEKDAAVFLKLSEVAPDEWKRVSEILKAAAAAIAKSGLFKVVGGRDADAPATATEEMEKRADAIVAEKKVRKSVAMGMVATADPALYQRSEDERKSRARAS